MNAAKNKYRLLFLFVFIGTFSIFAQRTGSIRGLVSDSTSGAVLPFANVVIRELNTGVSSNDKGYFTLSALKGGRSYRLEISYVGYITKDEIVNVEPDRITEIEVKLIPNPIEIQTVEKIGRRIVKSNETDIGLMRISPKELERMPQSVEDDVLRSLQYLPGVASAGDISAKYFVRGGESNQNLVTLDGITVFNPFHAMGVFSSIDPEIISGIEFYKGGFPVEFGGRLSSVLNIVTREGNSKRFGGRAGVSFLSGKALIEGPIPHGSFIVSGRKSYSTKTLKKFFNGKELPFDFYDVSFKINYQNLNPDFIDNGKFTVHGFFSGDKLLNSDPYLDDYKWKNNLLGFKRFQVYDIPMFSEISIAASSFESEVTPKLSGNRPKKNKVEEVTVRADFTYVYDSKDQLGIGMIFNGLRTELKQANRTGINIDMQDFGGNVVIYGKYKYLRSKNFGLDAGLRVNLEAYKRGGSFFIEPRVNFTYRIIPAFALKGSWGLFQQGVTTINDESEVVSIFEPWFIIPAYLKPARAIHYNIGFDFDVGRFSSQLIDGYFKVLQHLPTLNGEKKFNDDPDLVEGSGQSYGWEFSWETAENPVYFSLAYSLGWAYKTVDDWKYYPRYDSRHSVKALLNINLGAGWQAGAAWIYYSGFPFTPQIGFYNKLRSDDFTDWNDFYENYSPQVILGDRNVNRLPDYHRLDFTLSKAFKIGSVKLKAEANIMNVYNRNNLFYFDRKTGERVNMMPFLATAGLRMEI